MPDSTALLRRVAVTCMAVAACSGVPAETHSRAAAQVDAWQPIGCTPTTGKSRDKLLLREPCVFGTPMAFTSPVDFLGLYRMHATQQLRPLGHTVPAGIDRFDQTGTMCKTSSDPIACKARVQSLFVLHAQCPADEAKCTPFIVTTLGDDVRRIDDRAEMLRLLGAIDSVEKAVIVAFWERLDLRCWQNGYGA
ncbi:MAG TPA: hypothetical protein VJV78_10695 [Polyangiales bacterium]|nr:hypothetical protein [Polyangiales bacterium]